MYFKYNSLSMYRLCTIHNPSVCEMFSVFLYTIKDTLIDRPWKSLSHDNCNAYSSLSMTLSLTQGRLSLLLSPITLNSTGLTLSFHLKSLTLSLSLSPITLSLQNFHLCPSLSNSFSLPLSLSLSLSPPLSISLSNSFSLALPYNSFSLFPSLSNSFSLALPYNSLSFHLCPSLSNSFSLALPYNSLSLSPSFNSIYLSLTLSLSLCPITLSKPCLCTAG